VTNAQKTKGDRAEREAAAILADRLGACRRRLGAGRMDDMGDLELDERLSCAVQVADWHNIADALVRKVWAASDQAHAAGLEYGVAMLRIRGGTWRVAMDVDTFCRLLREATA
jgi:hypothetical protein